MCVLVPTSFASMSPSCPPLPMSFAGDTTESSYPEIRSPEADVRSILPFVGMPTVAEEETGQWDFDVSSVGRW